MTGRLIVAAVILAYAAGNCQSVREPTMNGNLAAVPVANVAAVVSLRLIDRGGPTLLLLTEPPAGSLTVTAVSPGASQKTELLSAAPASVVWDAAAADDGSVTLVSAVPESAAIWLSLVNTRSGPAMSVSRKYPAGLFGTPHFIKGARGSLAVSATVDSKQFSGAVIFPPPADGQYGDYRQLPSPQKGELLDARLVRLGSKYLLFTRFLARSGAARHPGVLYLSELDADFRETRAAEPCLNGRDVFDFDVDAAGNGAVLFAATARGYVLTSTPRDAAEEIAAGELSATSVLATGAAIHLAAIDRAGTASARVLFASTNGLK